MCQKFALKYNIIEYFLTFLKICTVLLLLFLADRFWEIVFFPRLKVGCWLSGIDGTVGPPQQQLILVLQNAGCIHLRLWVYGGVDAFKPHFFCTFY